MGVPFGSDPTPESAERFIKTLEVDRLTAAFDGSDMVATFGALTMILTVPGGQLPMAGTTVVTVLPTHRRQGVLREMMDDHLRDVHKRGEPIAGLWASESSIYGRFGYGVASERAQMTLDKQWARLREPVDIRGYIRLVDTKEALEIFPDVYQAVAATRPGMLARSDNWWEYRVLLDPEEARHGATEHRRAVCSRAGRPVGYVLYRWLPDDAAGTITVQIIELLGVDSLAERQLWQFLFGTDLVTSFRYWNQPVDDSLNWWLEQPRRAQRAVDDALWLRLTDVPAALSGRKYSAPGSLTIGVQDHFCPWNENTYHLEVKADGSAHCEATSSQADITVAVDVLSALYLGGHRFVDLARAGLLAGEGNSLRLADSMFTWHRRPWVEEIF